MGNSNIKVRCCWPSPHSFAILAKVFSAILLPRPSYISSLPSGRTPASRIFKGPPWPANVASRAFAIGNRIAAVIRIERTPTIPSLALFGIGRLRICLIRPASALLDSTTPISRRPRAGRLKAIFATSTSVCGYFCAFSPIATSTASSTACSRILRITKLASHNNGL